MRLRYIYSACTVIETEDVKIVSDPWFTPGAYDGSWFQYPVIDDPITVIGPVELIYISHIHPDHYDPLFLRKYLAAYPQAKLMIGETSPNYLLHKMRVDGFSPEVADTFRRGNTECFILSNHGYDGDNIDTALVVRNGQQSAINMNDNPFDARQVDKILSLLPHGKATAALLPYTGAGPYPQTYQMDERTLHEKVNRKKEQFLTLFRRYVEVFDPAALFPLPGNTGWEGLYRGLMLVAAFPMQLKRQPSFPAVQWCLPMAAKHFSIWRHWWHHKPEMPPIRSRQSMSISRLWISRGMITNWNFIHCLAGSFRWFPC